MGDKNRGPIIIDYLSGQEIEETAYEEFRQALARKLVEEKGYPREALRPRVEVVFPIDGGTCSRTVDIAACGPDGSALLILMFSPGVIASYYREVVAAARLLPGGPAPLAVVTDTKEAALLRTSDGEVLAQGLDSIPAYNRLAGLAAANPAEPLAGERLYRERRILYAYSGFLAGGCGDCPPPGGKTG